MLSEEILNDERLFRRIPLNPISWNFETNRPSSAAFKQSTGTSVDRSGERTDNQVIQAFTQQFLIKAIVTVTAGYCREIEAYPIYKPVIPDNIYHAEIHDSENIERLKGSKAKKLADSSVVVFVSEATL